MKNILRFSAFALASLLMVACNDDYKDWANPISYPEEAPVVVPTVTVSAASTETIDLEQAEATVQLLTVTAESSANLKNIQFIPIDAAGVEIADAAVTGIDGTGKFSKDALVEMIKTIFGKKRVEHDFSGNVYANIAVAGSSEYTLAKLNTVTIKLTPPDPGYENFYVVGTPNGWTIRTNGTYMIPKEKGVYTFTTYYSGAWDFKFISENDQDVEGDDIWKYCWGSTDNDKKANEGELFYGAGTAEAGCITPEAAGYYTFTADMNTSTYEFTKLDNQNPTEYSSMGVIGDFNSWSSDEVMTQVASHFWYVEFTLDADSGLKFRANGGWDVNWGTAVTISDEVFYGVATQGGSNITVPAGKYAFYLNDITGEFAIVAK